MAAVERDDRGLLRKAVIAVPAIVIAGSLIGYASNSGFGNAWFDRLTKPSFMPAGWVFGVVWTTLYTMLGIALATVLNEPPSKRRSTAVALFAVQLALNFAWSPTFFGGAMIDAALVTILVMLALASATAVAFARLRPLAGALMLPYLAWLCLATALNYEIGRLNPGADSAPLGITGA